MNCGIHGRINDYTCIPVLPSIQLLLTAYFYSTRNQVTACNPLSTHAHHLCVHKCTAERRLQWDGATNLHVGILISGNPYLTFVYTFDVLYLPNYQR